MSKAALVQHDAFNLDIKTDPFSGLSYGEYQHRCGLRLLLQPKPGFVRKFAAFGIPFGSIYKNYIDEEGQSRAIPAGSAHYLEHCIFSRDDEGGLMGKLSALGCQANAYTSYVQTVYYFSGTAAFGEAFHIYLDALLHPYLEEDRIIAERGIIGAELDMYKDDPDSFAFHSLMNKLYLLHGAKDDIGGTRESIATIDAHTLKQIWALFYSPSQMQIVVVGDFSEEEQKTLLRELDRVLSAQTWAAAVNYRHPEEPAAIELAKLRLELAVENPSFILGIKDPYPFTKSPLDPIALGKRTMSTALYLDSIIGEGSSLYTKLYEEGLINDSFTAQYLCEDSFAFFLLSCETEQPAEAAERILELLRAELKSAQEPGEIFTIQKKASLGHLLRAIDGVDSLGMTLMQAHMAGLELGEYARIIDQVSIAEAKASLSFLKNDALRVTVLVAAKGETS